MTLPAASPSLDGMPALQATYVRLVLRRLADDGIDVASLARRAGRTSWHIEESDGHVAVDQLGWIVLAAARGRARAGFALEAGLACHMSLHGPVGVAAMTARTARAAIHALTRYLTTRLPVLHLTLDESSQAASLSVQLHCNDDLVAAFLAEFVAGVLVTALRCVLPPSHAALSLRMRRASGAQGAFERADVDVTVDAEGPCLRFEVSTPDLDLPSPAASGTDHAWAVEACERSLRALWQDGSIRDAVRRVLYRVGAQDLSLAGVAAIVGVSTRTLDRRLRAEGTSFSEQLDAHRRDAALWSMRHSSRSIADIALSLGYDDPSNFSRCFRRWFGCTPSDMRRGCDPVAGPEAPAAAGGGRRRSTPRTDEDHGH